MTNPRIQNTILVLLTMFCLLLLFYTAYDKSTKTLVLEKVIEVVSFSNPGNSLNELNKVVALESIGLITLVFILGPLSKIWPKVFARFIYLRKPLGLVGFGFATIHGVYSAIAFYNLDIFEMIINNPKGLGIISGVLAFTIFLVMSITSSKHLARQLGYKKWKAIQTFGYVGLFLSILHFYVLETKPILGLDVRPFGLVFFYIPIIAILLRLAIILLNTPERKSYEEHMGEDE